MICKRYKLGCRCTWAIHTPLSIRTGLPCMAHIFVLLSCATTKWFSPASSPDLDLGRWDPGKGHEGPGKLGPILTVSKAESHGQKKRRAKTVLALGPEK